MVNTVILGDCLYKKKQRHLTLQSYSFFRKQESTLYSHF